MQQMAIECSSNVADRFVARCFASALHESLVGLAQVFTVISAFVAAWLVGTVTATAQEMSPSSTRFVDLTPEFANIWRKSRAIPPDQQITAFKAHFEPLLPGFFRSKYFDPLISRSLATYSRDRHGIEIVRRSFASSIGPAEQSFVRAFGAPPVETPIFLIHSTGELDGSVRRIQGRDHLVFGADRIAQRLDAAGKVNVQPLIHHEMFHLHHNRYFKDCWDRLWCDIWREGLATYAARSLNPSATDDDLMIADLRTVLGSDPSRAICLVASKLDSADPNERRDFTSMNYTVPGMPPRFGYYVGYLVAKDLGSSHGLPRLAQMPPGEVRSVLEQSLGRLADCNQKGFS